MYPHLWKRAFLFLVLAVFLSVNAVAAPLGPGSRLPDIKVPPLVDRSLYGGLGMDGGDAPFDLKSIKADMLVMELFNRFCFSCLRQTEEMQRYFIDLDKKGYYGKVRVLAVGIGNDGNDLKEYSRTLKTTFPIAADPGFEFYYGLGDIESAPVTLFLRKEKGGWVVADIHFGVQGATEMMARTKVLLAGKEGKPPAGAVTAVRSHLSISDKEKADYAEKALKSAGAVGPAAKLKVKGADVYRASGGKGALYAVVSARTPICDLCHDSLFAFVFDEKGEIKAFLPIYLTKYGNEAWSDQDEKFMESRLVGRKSGDILFSSDVDAVTSATMSSTIIFDEAKRAGKIVTELAKGGKAD